MTQSRVPFRATYRLQLTPGFGFAAARELIPYLRDLGVSHLYLSPSLQARDGSTHGYDVIDPGRISDDLSGEAEFRALAAAARGAELGIVLDVVPNHMATDEHNRYWTDPALRRRFFDLDPQTGEHRRFFDIADLAGVRQEDEGVFEETHRLVLSFVREGLIDALRIDHPDGLADPAQYFRRLRAGGAETVWIEKILESSERLRDWPVSGTVGYEFLNDLCGLFVDPAVESAFTNLWQAVSGDRRNFGELALEAKLEQARGAFAPEIERLDREQAVPGGVEGLAESVARFPIYRSYVQARPKLVDDSDRRAIEESGMPATLGEMLLLQRPVRPEFVTRFQQTTPAVVAKGVEDTAFYRYGRLIALCDVGGDPGRFGISAQEFHAGNAERAERFPLGLLSTNTHDTKRSADVRARIAALTWMPARWEEHVRRWMELTEPLRTNGAPDDLERYFLFQTLVGAWPIESERIEQYIEKALREAKRNTNWIDQNSAWEASVKRFCGELYTCEAFLEDFKPFVADVAGAGDRIALGMVALKLTAPGIPDIYQGDELPFYALVDPDNRRPVDWRWHQAMLSRLQGGSPPDAATRKLWLTQRLLALRIRRPHAFAGGDYEPLDAGDEVVAFMRGSEVLVVVAVRPEVRRDELRGSEGAWRDVLHGGRVTLEPSAPVSELLDEHGIAVLERV